MEYKGIICKGSWHFNNNCKTCEKCLDTDPNKKSKKSIQDLTEKDLFHLVDLATGGHFSQDWCSDKKEVEVGGYGKRRRIEWILTENNFKEPHYFEISSENPDGWAWHSKCAEHGDVDSISKKPRWKHTINCIAPHRIVDYLRQNNFNIENKK